MISKRKENSSPKMFEKLIDNKYFPKKEIEKVNHLENYILIYYSSTGYM